MQFIPLSDHVQLITCIALSPSKQRLAIFEQHEKTEGAGIDQNVYLSLYEMRGNEPEQKRPTVNLTDLFSGNGTSKVHCSRLPLRKVQRKPVALHLCSKNGASSVRSVQTLKKWP